MVAAGIDEVQQGFPFLRKPKSPLRNYGAAGKSTGHYTGKRKSAGMTLRSSGREASAT